MRRLTPFDTPDFRDLISPLRRAIHDSWWRFDPICARPLRAGSGAWAGPAHSRWQPPGVPIAGSLAPAVSDPIAGRFRVVHADDSGVVSPDVSVDALEPRARAATPLRRADWRESVHAEISVSRARWCSPMPSRSSLSVPPLPLGVLAPHLPAGEAAAPSPTAALAPARPDESGGVVARGRPIHSTAGGRARSTRVLAIDRREVDLDRFVAALLALAIEPNGGRNDRRGWTGDRAATEQPCRR